MNKCISLLLALVFTSNQAFAQAGPIIWGPNKAKNLTNELQFKSLTSIISGSVDPSAIATPGEPSSIYLSSSGTAYIKQDSGTSTNWLPLGVASPGTLTTVNGQSGPAVNIASGSAGTDFSVSAAANVITLDIPTSSASNRGLLSSANWTTFNNKEPAVTATTSADYYRGDKTFQALNKAAVGLSSVDNTSDASKPISTATQTALDLKADLASPTFTGTVSGISKSMVGLGNVDNTSDANKPVSTATQTALNLKADLASPTFTGTVSGITKSMVGLGNVDNTTDANKPVSTATQTALDAKVAGAAASVDSELMLFSGTGGKTAKRASGTGYVKTNSGVASNVTNADILGKSQANSSVTIEELQVPNSQLTQTASGKYLLDNCGSSLNILANCDFEAAISGNVVPSWTLTAGTVVGDATVKVTGEQSAKITLSSQTLSFYQDSTRNQAQLADGVNGSVGKWVKTSVSGIFVCPRQAATSQLSLCATVDSSNKWQYYPVPSFVMGGTSNGVIVVSGTMSNGLVTVGNVTGDVWVDGAMTKPEINLSTTDATKIVAEAYIPATANCSWVNTTSAYTDFTADVDCPAATIVQGFIGVAQLPQVTFSNLPIGRYELTAEIPKFEADASAETGCLRITDGTNTGTPKCHTDTNTDTINADLRLSFSTTSSTSPTFKIQGYDAALYGNDTSRAGSIRFILRYFGTNTVISSQCGAACENHLTSFSSSTGTISTTTPSGWVTGSAVITSTSTYTIPITGLTAKPNCGCSLTGTGECNYLSGSSSSSSIAFRTNGSTGSAAVSDFTFWCDKTGADLTTSRTMMASVKETLTTSGVPKPEFFSVSYGTTAATTACSASPCSYLDQIGSAVTSVTRSAQGTYAMVLAKTYTKLKCSLSAVSQTANGGANLNNLSCASCSSLSFGIGLQGTSAYDSYGTLLCEGYAP